MSDHIESEKSVPHRIKIGKRFRRVIEGKCPTCNFRFLVEPYRIKNGVTPFCSRQCRRGLKKPVEQRFWSKINKNGPTPQRCNHLGPCWVWTAGVNRQGYGVFNIVKRDGASETKTILAHKAAWNLDHGLPISGDGIKNGLDALHKCDNPPCCNPTHLWRGTHLENMQDAAKKGRMEHGVARSISKLNPEKVVKMKLAYNSGCTSYKALGDMFCVSGSAAREVIAGRTWRHVTMLSSDDPPLSEAR